MFAGGPPSNLDVRVGSKPDVRKRSNQHPIMAESRPSGLKARSRKVGRFTPLTNCRFTRPCMRHELFHAASGVRDRHRGEGAKAARS